MIQRVSLENPEENDLFQNCAAPGAANETQNIHIDPDLQTIIERWNDLPLSIKTALMDLVNMKDSED